jgi:hypothetical protein
VRGDRPVREVLALAPLALRLALAAEGLTAAPVLARRGPSARQCAMRFVRRVRVLRGRGA